MPVFDDVVFTMIKITSLMSQVFTPRMSPTLSYQSLKVMRQDQNIVWVEIKISGAVLAINETLPLYNVKLHIFFSLRHMETMKVQINQNSVLQT